MPETRRRTTYLKLKSPPARDCRPEEQIEGGIVKGLGLMRYRVLRTTHRYKMQTCEECGHRSWPQGGYGASYGVPDLLVSADGWTRGAWLGMECKTEKGTKREAQADLEAAGRIVIVRSWEDALREAQAADHLLRRSPDEK